MINVSEAICTETTAVVLMYLEIGKHWDADNQPVMGGHTPGLTIRATPAPMSELGQPHGEVLSPDKYGERTPATMRFTSELEMPINALVEYGGEFYKIISEADRHTAGYWQALGKTMPNQIVPNIVTTGYESMTIDYRGRQLPITRLIR